MGGEARYGYSIHLRTLRHFDIEAMKCMIGLVDMKEQNERFFASVYAATEPCRALNRMLLNDEDVIVESVNDF